MTDISEAERLALITHAQVALVLKEAEIAELEARAFSQDRARSVGPMACTSAPSFPFRRGGNADIERIPQQNLPAPGGRTAHG